MASYEAGKTRMVYYVKNNWKKGGTCLDVGSCDGVWYWLLGDYLKMDGLEVFKPYIDKYNLDNLYEHVFNIDLRNLKFKWYDYIIMGDVLEHLSVEDAQKYINYIYNRCEDFIIAVPFNYEQEAINDNENEIHLQPDLTPELVSERYPQLQLLLMIDNYYAYYIKKKDL